MTAQALRKPSVMFVDDERRVLTSMRALFRRDYNVLLANSGDEALELLEGQDVDVIVSDQRMPGLTGVDVLKACKQRAPRAMRILLTGYADKEAIAASINEGEVFRYLTKPCARDALRETVALAVAAASTAPASRVPDDEIAGLPASNDATAPAPSTPGSAPEPAVEAGLPAPRPAQGAAAEAIELLMLSADQAFVDALQDALGGSYRLHVAGNLDQAMAVLDSQPIGVVITDMAVAPDEVQALTTQLKHQVPELVTIVASDHSDAHQLIDLINGGQVFRFLLKPIRPKQTAIWIGSAVGKHLELVQHPDLMVRHAVEEPGARGLFQLGDRLVRRLAERFQRLRGVRQPAVDGDA